MPGHDDTNERKSATLPDLGPEFNAAREHLRATVLAIVGDGMHDGDPLKCTVTAAVALLGQATADRDRLAAELHQAEVEINRLSNANGALARSTARLHATIANSHFGAGS